MSEWSEPACRTAKTLGPRATCWPATTGPCSTSPRTIGYRAAWGAGPAQVEEIEQIAIHDTADPEVIIAEQVVRGSLPATGASFSVPGLLVLRVRDGLLTRVRDYMDSAGVAAARS
ncbi:nuclear transport factor 2 family protein [Streptomyces sp. NPDC051896]|uniref:nuclear transport factor 2 family protein n=1 Tax=Streptomyces sp. NPDC051896 TaxID=3155416 RepID=UPI00342E68C0